MTSVAELRMDVDSRSVRTAANDLDALSGKAGKAESSTNKLGASTRNAKGSVAGMAREVSNANQQVNAFDQSIRNTIRQLSGWAVGIFSVTTAARGLFATLDEADRFKALENRIRLSTDSLEEFAQVQESLIEISQRTFASLDGTVQGFQRISAASDRLGVSQTELLGITETVNKAIALSGATTQAAEASIIQFGQALTNNFEASSQEINSLNDQVFALSDAIASGITKVTGVETFRGDLKGLAEDGRLSSELVIRALQAVGPEIDKTFASLSVTAAQARQNLKTSFSQIANAIGGPLNELRVDLFQDINAQLSNPQTLAAAARFGETIADAARFIADNADAAAKALQGIAAGLAFSSIVSLLNAARAAAIGFSRALSANPLLWIPIAIAGIVTFRDEITRLLTPFDSFSELASQIGPRLQEAFSNATLFARGLFEIVSDLTKQVGNFITQAARLAAFRFGRLGGAAPQERNQTVVESQFVRNIQAGFGAVVQRGRSAVNADAAASLASSSTRTLANGVTELSRAATQSTGVIEELAEAFSKSGDSAEDAAKKLAAETAKRQDRNADDLRERIDATIGQFPRGAENFADNPRRLEQLRRGLDFQSSQLAGEIRDALRRDDITQEQADELGKVLGQTFLDGSKAIGDAITSASEAGGISIAERIRRAASNRGLSGTVGTVTEIANEAGVVFESVADAIDELRSATSKSFASVSRSIANLAQQLGKGLQSAGAGIGGQFGSFLNGLGQIGQAISATVSLVRGVVRVIGGLFSKPSGFQANVVFDPNTGRRVGDAAQRDDSDASNENARLRDTIANSIFSASSQIAQLTGARINSLFNVQVDNRNGITIGRQGNGQILDPQTFERTERGIEAAVNTTIERLISSLEGGDRSLVEFASSALSAGRSIEEVTSVLAILAEVSAESNSALIEYARASANAGRSSESIQNGVSQLSAALRLADQPLSGVAQTLRDIANAVDPVITDLQALGLSISGVTTARQAAELSVGEAFIDSIRNLNVELQNTVLGQFNRILAEIEERENDARLLLARGAITQQQFGFVQSTSGLQAANFFQSLSDEDKASLAGSLGLLRTASGDIATARVELEEQFNFLIDNVEETARGFEEAARNFERLGQNLRETADNIRVEFSGLTRRDQVDTLTGRVSELLNQARDSDATTQSRQSALTALPQVVNSLVQAARGAFGGTGEFGRVRDFGLSALDEAATLSEALAAQNFAQAENARADVQVLTEIRELLNDDRQLSTLQDILDAEKLTNTLIAQQVQAFLNLFSNSGSNLDQITAEQLQAAATQRLAQQTNASPPPTASAPQSASPISTISDSQLAQIIADNSAATDRNASKIDSLADSIADLTLEIRRDRVARSA